MNKNHIKENAKMAAKSGGKVALGIGKIFIEAVAFAAEEEAKQKAEYNSGYGEAVEAIASGISDSYDARVATSFVKKNQPETYYKAIAAIANSDNMDSYDKRVAISML